MVMESRTHLLSSLLIDPQEHPGEASEGGAAATNEDLCFCLRCAPLIFSVGTQELNLNGQQAELWHKFLLLAKIPIQNNKVYSPEAKIALHQNNNRKVDWSPSQLPIQSTQHVVAQIRMRSNPMQT